VGRNAHATEAPTHESFTRVVHLWPPSFYAFPNGDDGNEGPVLRLITMRGMVKSKRLKGVKEAGNHLFRRSYYAL
jgi:hypothetical protein